MLFHSSVGILTQKTKGTTFTKGCLMNVKVVTKPLCAQHVENSKYQYHKNLHGNQTRERDHAQTEHSQDIDTFYIVHYSCYCLVVILFMYKLYMLIAKDNRQNDYLIKNCS